MSIQKGLAMRFRELRRHGSWIRPVLWTGLAGLLIVTMASAAAGCKRQGQEGPAPSGAAEETTDSQIAPYPADLSPESTPEEVVQRLIRALEGEDKQTLLGLVAVEAEMKAVDDIYRRYGRRSPQKPAQVAALTAAGWGASYVFLQPGQSKVEESEVQGERASVFVAGIRRDGEDTRLKVDLLREDGVWKVRAGLKALE